MTKKDYCDGCTDNFYNGNNPYNIKECWSLESAKIVLKKMISINQVPPWNQEPIKVLSCFKKKGYVFVDKNVVR